MQGVMVTDQGRFTQQIQLLYRGNRHPQIRHRHCLQIRTKHAEVITLTDEFIKAQKNTIWRSGSLCIGVDSSVFCSTNPNSLNSITA